MKTKSAFFLAVMASVSVVTQYYLMIENRVTTISETTIRFFSFFTILTNLIVAVFFILYTLKHKNEQPSIINKPGTLTAVTVYITIVGLVYQILLRHIWEPKGIQRIVDELLHTILPILVILFWYCYENKAMISYKLIPRWLVYPMFYLLFIVARGSISGFYPYPFVDVENLGLLKVLLNSAGLVCLFIGIATLFIKIGKIMKANN